jgi:branched-chain amino acid transport system permease protein
MTLPGGMCTFASSVIGAFTMICLQEYLTERVGSWVTAIIDRGDGSLAFLKWCVGELIALPQRRGQKA